MLLTFVVDNFAVKVKGFFFFLVAVDEIFGGFADFEMFFGVKSKVISYLLITSLF